MLVSNTCKLYLVQISAYQTKQQQSDEDLLHMIQMCTNTSHHNLKPCSLSPMSLELLDVRLHADDKLSLRWPPTRFVYWLTLDRVSAASGDPLHVKQYPDSLLALEQSQMSSNSRQTFHDRMLAVKSIFYVVDCTIQNVSDERQPKASYVCCFMHVHQAAIQTSAQTLSKGQLTYDWSACSAYLHHLLQCCYD